MTTMDRTTSWGAVGLPILAIVAVGSSLISPLTAIVAGPTLLLASLVVYRRAGSAGLRGLSLITAAIGVGLLLLVVIVGLLLVAV